MATILLIDDDQVLLKLYSTRLAADHHKVLTASNGQEGLDIVSKQIPDIVLLDLLMPKLNGFKFIETLNKYPQTKDIPIIVFSSVANQEQFQLLNQLGIKTFLNKIDITPTQLVNVINQQLSQTQKVKTDT
jgi:twitching motility two-component system response regulator PilH